MTFYKIRHKPTGLFFKPSRHRSKTNLSKKGKIYERKPSMGWLGFTYHHPAPGTRDGYESRRVEPGEWEIVEYKTEVVT